MTKNYYRKMACYFPNGDKLELPDGTNTHLWSAKGQKWLSDPNNRLFRCMRGKRSFTARKETSKNGQGDYWYAYRKVEGKLQKRYIGKTEDLTFQRLCDIALALDTSPKPRQKASKPVDVTQELYVTKTEVERLQALVEKLQSELGNVSSELEAERVKLSA